MVSWESRNESQIRSNLFDRLAHARLVAPIGLAGRLDPTTGDVDLGSCFMPMSSTRLSPT
jgi:hypothetical protein